MTLSTAPTVPAKKPRIAIYLSPETYRIVEALAIDERRSLSQMAAMLIEERLQEMQDLAKKIREGEP